MRYIGFLLCTLAAFPATADSVILDWVVAQPSRIVYADQALATTQSQKQEFVNFVGYPYAAECGPNIRMNTEQMGRITGPLELAILHSRAVRVRFRNMDPATDRGCFLQGFSWEY